MKQESNKSPKKGSQEEAKIDIHNDDEMRENGLWRPYDQTPRDPSVWTKTKKEKEDLKNMKSRWKKEDMHFHSIPVKQTNIKAKLIVYLGKEANKVKKFDRTTYSSQCYLHNIENVLSKYKVWNNKMKRFDNLVVKYSYNGKTYEPHERPFWE